MDRSRLQCEERGDALAALRNVDDLASAAELEAAQQREP
jgi:hypothetical protein